MMEFFAAVIAAVCVLGGIWVVYEFVCDFAEDEDHDDRWKAL